MIEPALYLLILALLLALDLLTVAARAAYAQFSHARLLSLRDQDDSQFKRVAALWQAQPRLRAAFNLSLVLLRFLLAWVVVSSVNELVSQLSLQIGSWLAVGLSLFLAAGLLFVLEWAVERVVSHNPEQSALHLALFVKILLICFTPFLVVGRVFFGKAAGIDEPTALVTEDELRNLVDAGQEDGAVEEGERRMIHSIFQLGDTLAREIMVPRIDMLALEASTPLPEAIDALISSGHSRVPVFEETVDNTLGVLYTKDLLKVWREDRPTVSLRELIRPAYFVPEAKRVDELLAEMQSQRIHIALVVDEYGGIAGLVTLEDIVEEILGEIRDEYDQAEELPYQVLKDGNYQFIGGVGLDDFNDRMGSELPTDEADTLGGYIYSQLGRVPVAGDTVQSGRLLLTVEQVSARRIRKVRAAWLTADAESEEKEEHVDG